MRSVILQRIILLIVLLVTVTEAAVAARSPLGIGVAEQTLSPASPFAAIFLKIQAWQMQFERGIQQVLIGMRDDVQGILWLVGLSFLYGILHAAGPGHGKAVIASYLVADHASLRRGIVLSFFSSILQALSAISIIVAIFLFLPGQLTQTTHFVVLLSYCLVVLVGLWLLIRHSMVLFRRPQPAALDALFNNTSSSPPLLTENATMGKNTDRPHLAWRGNTKSSLTGFREICAQCGGTHLISADHLQQKLRLRTALSLICATGLRPCNGALFVMSFALLNQLEIVGIVSVFAMALGTFITVSLLASLAVYAKRVALILSSRGNRTKPVPGSNSWRLKSLIEWVASLFIFVTGILLLVSLLI